MNENPRTWQETHKKKLDGTAVILIGINDRIRDYVESILSEWAEVLKSWTPEEIITSRAQRVAVIIGQTDETELKTIFDRFDLVAQDDPSISIRYFYLTNKPEQDPGESWKNDRARIIYYPSIAPLDLPERMKRSLYKARLPKFLRTGFNVEIHDETKGIDSINYRKITIRTFVRERLERELRDKRNELEKLKAEIEKWPTEKEVWRTCQVQVRKMEKALVGISPEEVENETTNLFIHNKELYQLTNKNPPKVMVDQMEKISEKGLVIIKKGKYCGPVNLEILINNNQTEE